MCLKSKAVFFVTLWSFLSYAVLYMSIRSSLALFQLSVNLPNIQAHAIFSAFYSLNCLLYPFGGLIGDIGCERYKIIRASLRYLCFASGMLASCGVLILVSNLSSWSFHGANVSLAMGACLVLLSILGLVPFFANIVPFAMDQLRDLPARDSGAFIWWYIWTLFTPYCITSLIFSAVFNFNQVLSDVPSNVPIISESTCLIVVSLLIFVTVVVTSFVTGRREEWFNAEPRKINPYKLVYKVSKFAWQHKIPVHRSAFTYCEDDQPSRLDLGKSKYGGPFTTEEVEDVKVFYEILKVLVSLGPFMYVLNSDIEPTFFEFHLISDNFSKTFVKFNGLLSYMLIAATIPVFLYFYECQPRLFAYLPTVQSLRKMETGMIIVLVKLVIFLLMDITAHAKNESLSCMFTTDINQKSVSQIFPVPLLLFVLVFQEILSALSLMLFYSSYFKFICAQSPQSMKGMLIGLTYALLLGLFGLLRLFLRTSLMYWKSSYPSCGFVLYSVDLVICLTTFVAFVWVAKRYKYRQRDELSRVRQYAEEYYSNTQLEPNYDYYSTSLL